MLTAVDSRQAIDNIRKIAHEIHRDPSLVTADLMEEVEGHFGELVDFLWEVHPGQAPDHLLRTLDNMPGEILEWFRNFLIQNERAIPAPVAKGWGAHWVIAPTI